MSIEDKFADLDDAFVEWVDSIIAAIWRPIPKQPYAMDTSMVGGMDLEGFKDVILASIDEHIDKKNIHELTSEQVTAFNIEQFESNVFPYQNKMHLPITVIGDMSQYISGDWFNGKLSIQDTNVKLLGSRTDVPGITLDLLSDNEQFLILSLSRTERGYDTEYNLSTDPSVTFHRIPVAKIEVDESKISTRRIVRIGMNELSITPKGTTIPVTDGHQSGYDGKLLDVWFDD